MLMFTPKIIDIKIAKQKSIVSTQCTVLVYTK